MKPEQDKPTAEEIMTTDVVTLHKNLTVLAAAQNLVDEGVSNAPVIEDDMTRKILVGFISEKDLMQCYANGIFYRQPDLTIAKIMRIHPVSVKPETGIFTLAAVFMQHDYRHVPVTQGGILLGMVSRRDVMKAFLEHYEAWLKMPESERTYPDLENIFTPNFIVG